LEAIVVDFLRDYPSLHHHWSLLEKYNLQKLCSGLVENIAEIDVERCMQTLSAKILELEKPQSL
jgi:hypothetical protein